MDKPEEPAKYIYEIPKLPAADISTSAVACGNWIAQVRQIFVGISPSSDQWWSAIERTAGQQYQRWLIADPVDRLLLDPATVVAVFDQHKYQRVESRAVSLVLAAVPQSVRDEAVSNRWLTTASLLFRIQCIYQPGGSSERAMLLSHLVSPEVAKSFGTGVSMLRRWQQNFHRVRELQASLPDPSLLLNGIDVATMQLLAQHPLLGFRVNAFRNRVSLDYNPVVATVLQLVKLLQAEFEAAALTGEPSPPDKKARAAAALTGDQAPLSKAAPPKASPSSSLDPTLKLMDATSKGDGKGKGRDKGSEAHREQGLCHHFTDGKGCKYGDSCRFKHDRALAIKQRRCLACGQEGHYRPACPLVSPENRMVQDGGSAGVQAPDLKAPPPRKSTLAKAKSGPQAKGIVEDPGSSTSADCAVASAATGTKEALIAEAAKLLKGVSLKPVQVQVERLGGLYPASLSAPDLGIDEGWLRSAVISAADQLFALVDSGATNALRPAGEGEVHDAKMIRVDLASGGTELHVNRFGTLLSTSPCQVIVPAGYLVQLGFSIAWKKKGCVIRRRGEVPLQVKVVKGCPLISRERGLQLLEEYEGLKESGGLASLSKLEPLPPCPLERREARGWLARKVAQGTLDRRDQITWLRAMCPEAPLECVVRAAGLDIAPGALQAEGVPWNRRKRRTVIRARPGEVLLHLFSGQQKWRCPGILVEVEKSKGVDLMATWVFQHILVWALKGVVGAVVGGPPCRTASACRSPFDGAAANASIGSTHWDGSGLDGHEQLVVPEEISDPMELARWALQKAAERLQARQADSPSPIEQRPRKVLFAWEHPANPEGYMPAEQRPPKGWASWWSFPEWKGFREVYDLHEARFDQACLGHPRPKPTVLATNSWYLYESLHERVLSREERAKFGMGPTTGQQRLLQSPLWGRWAPGLTSQVIEAWVYWGKEQGLWQDVMQRRVMLAKLKEEEAVKKHLESDHIPFRKGCPVCIASQGRQRSHWRASTKTVFAASFDLAGPFLPGRSYDPAASGRDRGLGYRYFLACAFTMPIKALPQASPKTDEDLPEEPGIIQADTGDAVDLPAWDDLFGDPVAAVSVRARFKRPEVADQKDGEGAGPPAASEVEPPEPPPLPPPSEAPLENPYAEEPPPSLRMLCLGLPVRSKKGKIVWRRCRLLSISWSRMDTRYIGIMPTELRS